MKYVFECGYEHEKAVPIRAMRGRLGCPEHGAIIIKRFVNCVVCGAEFQARLSGNASFCPKCRRPASYYSKKQRVLVKSMRAQSRGYSLEFKRKMAIERSDCVAHDYCLDLHKDQDLLPLSCAGCPRYVPGQLHAVITGRDSFANVGQPGRFCY